MGKATGGLVQHLSSCCVWRTNSDTLFNGSFGSFFQHYGFIGEGF